MQSAARRTPSRLSRSSGIAYGLIAVLMATGSSPANPIAPTVAAEAPDSLTDAEFWKFFTSMSEAGGDFLSENFVSNEVSFQEVIPTLQKSLTPGGVYLGVGPEQNFTYIANLAPRMAVIFDIRRQNAMQHLMYKALFELSPTRVQFVSRLFSRPGIERLPSGIAAQALFDSATAAPQSDSAYKANLAAITELLTVKHGFALSKDDIATIEHVYGVFFAAGPEVNYGSRMGTPGYVRSTYPNYGMLQAAMNADSVQMAFLATDANYGAVRTLQLRNLIVPVVGDFGGPSAIRSVGQWLHDRDMTVTAFYVSNVEQYLFRGDAGASERFYGNVTALPIDTTSRFIRSVPRMGGYPMMTFSRGSNPIPSGFSGFTITSDGRGNTITQTFRDSAGITLVQTVVDSSRRDTSGVATRIEATRGIATPGRRDSSDTGRVVVAADTMFVRRDSTTAVGRDSARFDTTMLAQLRNLISRRDSLLRLNATWQIASGPRSQVVMGGLLTSGIASMTKTLDSFFRGELRSYQLVVDMTKVTDWK